MPDDSDVTQLLQAWRRGDALAVEKLTPIVYQELHRLARGVFRGERADHTLQPTALVHEAFLHLVGANVDWQNRAHFFALAARQMRHILVNYAHAKRTAKRGGGSISVSLEDAGEVAGADQTEITDIDAALSRSPSSMSAEPLLELHYFGGLTYEKWRRRSEFRLRRCTTSCALPSRSSVSNWNDAA
jgi:RNA polymerase sigma factor (TIGR02999 family)